MWIRILRFINSVFNVYSFYSNPFRFIAVLLAAIVFPYLIYLFWSSLIIIVLSGVGLYFLYQIVKKGLDSRAGSTGDALSKAAMKSNILGELLLKA